ncbi:hypothetical protein BDV10DRAFT_179558 [Aspergillus recurvatus]
MVKRKSCDSVSEMTSLRKKSLERSIMIQHTLPVPPTRKSVACFYIQLPDNDFHRAIYVAERTISELRDQISRKAQIHTRCIIYRVPDGGERLADEAFVQQLTNGQSMIAEFGDNRSLDGGTDVVLNLTT